MAQGKKDWRNIANGWDIPKEHYCDQPYVVISQENTWVCVMTTGRDVEGEPGQHVVSTISRDWGRTWSPLVDIEPANGPEASWVMPLIVPSGRIYAFYTYNGDNIRQVTGGKFDGSPGEQVITRVDTLGCMAFKYSDDHGRTWSQDRHYIPIRNFAIDDRNRHGGKVQYFWGVGKPIVHEGAAYIGFAKVGEFGVGFMTESEGAFLKSDNILTEHDPSRIRWETLPEGNVGLRSPIGNVADEHNPVGLSDGSLYCTYRTVAGSNCHAYSRDGGRTWTPPAFAVYEPGGRRIKHPRAANFVKKFGNGNYLLWFHNHGADYTAQPHKAYNDRNPAWVSGGVERDGFIYWSQPEILLYDDNPVTRISYPDFIEQDGRYFVTETQKEIARVHEIDATLLEGMWRQRESANVAREGLLLELRGGGTGRLPAALGDLRDGGGFTLDAWLRPRSLAPGRVLMGATDAASGAGFRLATAERGALRVELNDGRTGAFWESDGGLLREDGLHHVAVIVDGGPKIIVFVVDGVLCDGGSERAFGWGRFNPHLRDVTGSGEAAASEEVAVVRVYGRALRTSEAVSHYRAGTEG